MRRTISSTSRNPQSQLTPLELALRKSADLNRSGAAVGLSIIWQSYSSWTDPPDRTSRSIRLSVATMLYRMVSRPDRRVAVRSAGRGCNPVSQWLRRRPFRAGVDRPYGNRYLECRCESLRGTLYHSVRKRVPANLRSGARHSKHRSPHRPRQSTILSDRMRSPRVSQCA